MMKVFTLPISLWMSIPVNTATFESVKPTLIYSKTDLYNLGS